MRSAARVLLLAAAVLLCSAPATLANKEACPLELIFPAEQLLVQGQPKAVTLKVCSCVCMCACVGCGWTGSIGRGGGSTIDG